ncbi:hypothetical protein [Bradyrhizobium manausense]|uniref:DUF5678 domain-containing protein n=1 Tax=Bradyrhizobium manausense TaxID=989370 RepID=A0A0R3DZT3_9BRAD|nr:hypothetical protein [Bradyrhizobium manausense]KRQ15360.1 hypothetical protein AOQ71_10190 [Bradyrhizobium manausense]
MNEALIDTIDLSRILDASHEDKWVAIAPDYSKVIASANSVDELIRLTGEGDVIFHRVLPHDVSFIPSVF